MLNYKKNLGKNREMIERFSKKIKSWDITHLKYNRLHIKI